MRILILGATGRTGKWVLKLALKKGYNVHILVRDCTKITAEENLTIFHGTPADKSMLSKAAENCKAIISVLNISRTSDFPWAKLRTPASFLSDVMHHIIQVSEKHQIGRVVVCSAWGVDATNSDLPFWFRWMIGHSNIGAAYTDHERQEKILLQSNLDWTIVRPVGLINKIKPQKILVSYGHKPKPKLTISRRSVGEFMVNTLEDDTLIRKLPTISSDY
ncbi:NAD-dependent epimerase/dehydratase family protein [Maribacter algarum]|uniref:NAD-dependent epimerase/dehydratase family protein n=1 Tax=Maribacter algarum (ex Zhang et al. 2020) TaxID=2578118 RepID=A0A5S3PWJ1_9FLAO|nr:NAD(P)H-binding protein [Maribacter algarum]TMM59343.1 NAD-dependent epimerase/dehydratase family protein [Maribacter algarum]